MTRAAGGIRQMSAVAKLNHVSCGGENSGIFPEIFGSEAEFFSQSREFFAAVGIFLNNFYWRDSDDWVISPVD